MLSRVFTVICIIVTFNIYAYESFHDIINKVFDEEVEIQKRCQLLQKIAKMEYSKAVTLYSPLLTSYENSANKFSDEFRRELTQTLSEIIITISKNYQYEWVAKDITARGIYVLIEQLIEEQNKKVSLKIYDGLSQIAKEAPKMMAHAFDAIRDLRAKKIALWFLGYSGDIGLTKARKIIEDKKTSCLFKLYAITAIGKLNNQDRAKFVIETLADIVVSNLKKTDEKKCCAFDQKIRIEALKAIRKISLGYDKIVAKKYSRCKRKDMLALIKEMYTKDALKKLTSIDQKKLDPKEVIILKQAITSLK